MTRASLEKALSDAYLRIDPRTLGLGRIGFALVLIGDLARRMPYLRELYSNAGLIPNHTVLWRPPFPRLFSLFFTSSLPEESALWFAICFACFFCFLIGYRTRLFHVLSFVMTTSLHNRILFAENWGGVAIGTLMIWTVFLPLGSRFSVDAVIASLRARPHETPAELAAGVPPPENHLAESLAVMGLLLQIAAIYWFNFVHKSGPTWQTGTAIYYVLHQERIVTPLGAWLREHLPLSAMKALTFSTLGIEATAPVLLLSPILWRWMRPLAGVLLASLHLGIALLINLGIFSAAMIAYDVFLLTPAQWRLFTRLVPTRGRSRTVFYDEGCGICYLIVRVLARLDVHRRLRWISNRDTSALPAGVDPALLERTVLVVQSRSGIAEQRWTRADACAEILMALPLGRFWAWPLRLPGARSFAGRAYDLFARHRTRISAWFGLRGCGVPGAWQQASASPVGLTPLRVWARERVRIGRELLVLLVFVVVGAEISIANRSVPPWLRFDHRPDWMVAAVMYPHLFEGWSLFAPDAPLSDQMVYVDAVTRDGRHVDPYNEFGSRVAALPVEKVPERLNHDSFWCDYTLGIPDAAIYHQPLIDWILRYPERTGRPEDTIVRFEAFSLTQDTPPPGETRPTNIRRRRFLQWP
jgi:predicted DCC family thiol-disulfide oxidoreductase YuxK